MDKSIVVLVNRTLKHPLYLKTVSRSKKFYAHDEKNEAGVGDKVRIMETRPLSKLKRWRLVEVVEKAK
jgi:small subunit ribosomal protein S17